MILNENLFTWYNVDNIDIFNFFIRRYTALYGQIRRMSYMSLRNKISGSHDHEQRNKLYNARRVIAVYTSTIREQLTTFGLCCARSVCLIIREPSRNFPQITSPPFIPLSLFYAVATLFEYTGNGCFPHYVIYIWKMYYNKSILNTDWYFGEMSVGAERKFLQTLVNALIAFIFM